MKLLVSKEFCALVGMEPTQQRIVEDIASGWINDVRERGIEDPDVKYIYWDVYNKQPLMDELCPICGSLLHMRAWKATKMQSDLFQKVHFCRSDRYTRIYVITGLDAAQAQYSPEAESEPSE